LTGKKATTTALSRLKTTALDLFAAILHNKKKKKAMPPRRRPVNKKKKKEATIE
jgi:hypothetical protein